tara:strand:- start:597 stop:1364 length:768 start_codon:yes stop_codon:yes gene_type:complete
MALQLGETGQKAKDAMKNMPGGGGLKTLVIGILLVVVIYLVYKLMFGANEKDLSDSVVSAKKSQTVSSEELPINKKTSNYTYSLWIYVNNWDDGYGNEKTILERVSSNGEVAPGIYLAPITNDILIKSALENGGQGTAQEHLCTLANIPLQKWMHLAVSLNTRALDVYLDGKLVRTCMLEGVAASNTNSNLRITPNGGFDGYTGSIKYIPDRINPQQAYELYKKGPGGSALGGLNKYKVRVALMEDGDEKQSFEL